MKLLPPVMLALTVSLFSHSEHPPSVHNEDLDLQKAHSRPPAKNEVEISVSDEQRTILSNGIPDHETGRFPVKGNPHTILEQNYRFTMPAEPEVAEHPAEVGHQLSGVALNGVVFDPATAEFYREERGSIWNHEALSDEMKLGLDDHHGHVQPNGAYHYHGLPTALFKRLSEGEKQMTLIGWAADGFPIYGLYGYSSADDSSSDVVTLRSSYKLKEGRRESPGRTPRGDYDGTFTADYEYVEGRGDLDECNGRHGVTPEFPEGTYHYVITADYPFIPRLFRGEPDPSFKKNPMKADGPPHGGKHGPPPHGRPPHGRPPRR